MEFVTSTRGYPKDGHHTTLNKSDRVLLANNLKVFKEIDQQYGNHRTLDDTTIIHMEVFICVFKCFMGEKLEKWLCSDERRTGRHSF